jgi:hypothetical protein
MLTTNSYTPNFIHFSTNFSKTMLNFFVRILVSNINFFAKSAQVFQILLHIPIILRIAWSGI